MLVTILRKSQILGCLVLLFPALLPAQEETLFQQTVHHGGYGAMVAQLTPVNGEIRGMSGFRGGWIVNHSMVLGAASYDLIEDVTLSDESYDFTYAGLELGYIFNPDELLHFSLWMLAGGGALVLRDTEENGNTRQHFTDGVLVLEPAIYLQMNITSYCHLGLGAGYRIASDVELPDMENSDLQGLTGKLSLEFGVF